MSDRFTEISEQGLGGSLMESIKGVAIGGLLFVVSFPLLWWNEGRPDMSVVAKKAQVVTPASVDKSAEGKLVSLTGPLKIDEKVGDKEFIVPGDYVQLRRVVEMYAWRENKETNTQKKLGGGKKTETTYTYEKAWTSSPRSSDSFKYPEGHTNPEMTLQGDRFSAAKATIGAYSFNPGDAEMPSGQPLKLSRDIIKVATSAAAAPADDAKEEGDDAGKDDTDKKAVAPAGDDDAAAPADDDADAKKAAPAAKKVRHHHGRHHRPHADSAPASAASPARPARRVTATKDAPRSPMAYQLASDTYLFRGRGTLATPSVGDIRISFTALRPGADVTLFGEAHSDEIKPYLYKGETRFFRALNGTRDEAIQTLATEHSVITWILRLVGFLIMWFGLMMFFGPINAVLDIIPFLGSAGRFLVGVVMFPIALILSCVTILVSVIAHSPILLALTVVGVAAGGYFLYQKRQAQKAAAAR